MDLSLLTTDFKEEYFRFIIDKYDLTDDIEKMLNKKEVKKFYYLNLKIVLMRVFQLC